MKNIRFISRSDDLGSSHSANLAIEKVVNAGFIKNVSVMACGPTVEEAASLLAHRREICFGMHTTLNAEWDQVKWGPVLELDGHSGLIDNNGFFLAHPSMFTQTKPPVEVIMREVSAQLDRLHRLGFPIRYIDSHMFPEMYVEGLDEAMEAFSKQKGLIDHMYYYQLPHWGVNLCNAKEIDQLSSGQYFGVSHPSLNTREMCMTGNASVRGEDIATFRARETALLSDAQFLQKLEQAGVQGIRYDEAHFVQRLTATDLARILSGG